VRGRVHGQSVHYGLKHAVDILKHLIVPEAQNSVTLLCQPSIASCITLVERMLPTVEFDNQIVFTTHEINNVSSNRLLTDKLVSADPP